MKRAKNIFKIICSICGLNQGESTKNRNEYVICECCQNDEERGQL